MFEIYTFYLAEIKTSGWEQLVKAGKTAVLRVNVLIVLWILIVCNTTFV